MGFLSKLKKDTTIENIPKRVETNYLPGDICAPVSGRYIPLAEVPDPAFAAGMLGSGCGIEPETGAVYAPVNGKIVSTTDTKHFIGIETDNGTSLLIHIGMDTVELQGKGFQIFVSEGQDIHCGELLLSFDMKYIKSRNYCLTTVFVISEIAEGTTFEITQSGVHKAGEKVGMIN